MPTLEVANLNSFIAEMGDNRAMFWGVDQPLQDDKQEPMIGLLLVMSCNNGKALIRFVENLGTVYTKNEKDVKEAVEKRAERVKAIQKILADKSKGYATGLWSNE